MAAWLCQGVTSVLLGSHWHVLPPNWPPAAGLPSVLSTGDNCCHLRTTAPRSWSARRPARTLAQAAVRAAAPRNVSFSENCHESGLERWLRRQRGPGPPRPQTYTPPL